MYIFIYQDVMLAVSEVFDMKFIWKNEDYIKKLFNVLSIDRILHHRLDPMSKHTEVRRNIVMINTR
jgi:hypothetical protein